jgi:hypothetical protein
MKGRVVGMHLGELVAGEDLRTALSGSVWRTVATISPAEPVASSRAPATKPCSAFQDGGAPIDALASRFGLSRRSVFRILARGRRD